MRIRCRATSQAISPASRSGFPDRKNTRLPCRCSSRIQWSSLPFCGNSSRHSASRRFSACSSAAIERMKLPGYGAT
jgi:hypothetical protein